jgi:2-polyprenyl-3-methyl-5-hydroxy-6-metoxy-1,4-benzoquinol methylase
MQSMKNLADQYTKDYFEELEKADQVEYPRNARIINQIQNYIKTGRLLDVGVGTGLFMEIAQKKGFEVFGLDVSEYAIKKIGKRLGIKSAQKLVVSELTNQTFIADYFDVVNMRHSIEHVKYPEKLLKNVYKILKPGGLVAIATPNSFGWHAKLFKELWPHWSVPYHIQFFSKQSLEQIVKNAGFTILKSKTEELTNYDIFRIFLKRLGLPINYNRATFLTKIANNILAKIGQGEGLLIIAQKPQ